MDQPVNQRTFAEGADEDDVFPKFVFARESAGERPVTRSTAAFSASELRKKMLFARYLQAGDMAIWSGNSIDLGQASSHTTFIVLAAESSL
jgi:hypothetical protein